MYTGDAAIALLKAGAETDKKDVDGYLPLELAPSKDVRRVTPPPWLKGACWQPGPVG